MPEMNRISIVQHLLDSIPGAETYVEIGIARGKCFLSIRAKRKLGIDPIENSTVYRKFMLLRTLKMSSGWLHARHYRMTSDDFFDKHATGLFEKRGIDVALVDGLHTYPQSLKDVQNALKYLKEDGAIVMHDCSPPHEAAAYPASSLEEAMSLNLPGWDSVWNGDVWKTIVNLRSTTRDLNIFVLDCDWGIGVITRGKSDGTLEYTPEQIDALSFQDLQQDRQGLINLKPAEYLFEFTRKKYGRAG